MKIDAFTVYDALFSSSSDDDWMDDWLDDWMDDWMLFSSSSDDDDWSSEASDENDERSESDVENEKLQQAKKQKRVPQNEQPSITPPKGPQPKKTPKCAICLDEIEKPTANKCGHVYCDQCIREWIRAQKTKSRCPQCRKNVGLSGLTKLILDD